MVALIPLLHLEEGNLVVVKDKGFTLILRQAQDRLLPLLSRERN